MIRLSFSTLACPSWKIEPILALASNAGYQGVELRFIEEQDALWKLADFSGAGLAETQKRIAGYGLAISCVDTSCFFHFAEKARRLAELEAGKRMADLAAELGAPGVRVFGDRVQRGADRASTVHWIGDAIAMLAEATTSSGVEVWLETHGDFASAPATLELLRAGGTANTGVLWDPANCFAESGELPSEAAATLGSALRMVHLKDQRQNANGVWEPTLMGQGTVPLLDILASLRKRSYRGFLSFEWEKKWHPHIPDASLAVPQFAEWIRRHTTPAD